MNFNNFVKEFSPMSEKNNLIYAFFLASMLACFFIAGAYRFFPVSWHSHVTPAGMFICGVVSLFVISLIKVVEWGRRASMLAEADAMSELTPLVASKEIWSAVEGGLNKKCKKRFTFPDGFLNKDLLSISPDLATELINLTYSPRCRYVDAWINLRRGNLRMYNSVKVTGLLCLLAAAYLRDFPEHSSLNYYFKENAWRIFASAYSPFSRELSNAVCKNIGEVISALYDFYYKAKS